MKLTDNLKRTCAKAYLPAAALIALLQRSPALQNAVATDESVVAAPVGTLLSSVAIAAASLGVVDATAGATLLASTTSTETEYPTGPLPTLNETIGKPIQPVAFTIANLITIGSWRIVGELPPGLYLTTVQPNGGTLVGYGGGTLDATTDTNELTTPLLEGTPTTSGTYQLSFQGFWKGGESGGPYGGKGVSAVFPYTIVVSSTLPTFNTQPLSAQVTGGTIALNALALGASSYQWMLNGSTPVAGATGALLLLNDAAAGVGTYTCVASNDLGSTTSAPAAVSLVATADIGRLTNISTRVQVGTGQNVLIAGFVVGGSGTSGSQKLLVRGSGPALGQFGITGTLPDPQLDLYSGSDMLGTDAGWGGDPLVSATGATLGAFAWPSATSKDSALLQTLPAGPYTAQVAGQSGDTGVALAEVYDATPAGTYTPTMPRIVNLSARVQVGTGAGILIAGFVVGGSTSRTVLIRASGPGLDQFGVAGTLNDPLLQVYSGANLLVSNQGWGGDARISAVAASVHAFAWLSPFSNDSAIIATLPPGSYTAQVSGATGDTGVTLIEIYEVP